MNKQEQRPFKVGDKVRMITRTGSNWFHYPPEDSTIPQVGSEYIVREVAVSSRAIPYLSFLGYDYGDFSCCFELVAPAPEAPSELEASANNEASELEQLVRKANDALAGIRSLQSREGLECKEVDDGENSWQPIYALHKWEFRVKPAPALPEPFDLPISHYTVQMLVSPAGISVYVGCQEFEIGLLKASLHALCKGKVRSVGPYSLEASRDGVHRGGYYISWADAEQLLAALEKIK